MEYGGGRSKTQRVDFVQHHGYVSLFPFLLDVLPETFGADKMAAIIDVVKSEKYLMSKAGLRSLFLDVHGERERETARDYVYTYLLLYYIYMYTHTHTYIYMYMVYRIQYSRLRTHTHRSLSPTAPGGGRDVVYGSQEDYWRGKVWININYLALAALHRHTHTHAHTTRAAADTYHTLRANLIDTITASYEKKGFLFEQYDDKTREGLKHKPFAGWTALVLLIMAEAY